MNQEKKTNVLLVEDNDLHANIYLFPEDVNVTRVSTFSEAMGQLYGTRESYGTTWMDMENRNPHGIEALLTDLNFPLGHGCAEFEEDALQSVARRNPGVFHEAQPLGYNLALIAAQLEIPKIGIYTDTNHHQGPVAATFDMLTTPKTGMKLGDSHLVVWDSRSWIEAYRNGWGRKFNEWSRNPDFAEEEQAFQRELGRELKCFPALLDYLNHVTRTSGGD